LVADEEKSDHSILVLLLLLLIFVIGYWVYKRRRSVVVVAAKDLMKSTEEELRQYQLIFDQVDKNGSGHITTTELLQAFKTLNVSVAAGAGEGRVGRHITIIDVERLRKKVDVDKNILIEFDEFVNIFKLERIDFAEELLRDADPKGLKGLDYDQVMTSLTKAGFSGNENWAGFIRQYEENQAAGKKVKYGALLQELEVAVTEAN